jgi:glycosyltransferase involved in cell wall biosynthesis
VDVFISDDASTDKTEAICLDYQLKKQKKLKFIRQPSNLGYGGNQKFGYQYAIDNGYDAVVLLHGDGQYAPELIPQLLLPIKNNSADVVIGSRMIHRQNALKGGMPLYKFIGNIVLTKIQNILLGSHLSEFHSGYRVYSTKTLSTIPFAKNSDYFDFDTDILIQCILANKHIFEIAIPTFYGKEISYVNGIKYALLILLSTLKGRLHRQGIIKSAKFGL